MTNKTGYRRTQKFLTLGLDTGSGQPQTLSLADFTVDFVEVHLFVKFLIKQREDFSN